MIKVALTLLLAAASGAIAQTYPSKPIRMIVGFAPGGGTDVTARAIVQELSEGLKQRILIDNRPGANGVIGTELAAKAPPDGYTLLMVNLGHTTNPAMYPKLPYDTMRDFAPISLVVMLPNLLVVHPSLPARTFPEFVRLARTRSGQINYGSGGQGAASHLVVELLQRSARINFVHVPYRSGGQSATALVSGEVAFTFNTVPSSIAYVKAGRLRALAVSTAQRSLSVPDISTIAEQGYPGFSAAGMSGLLAPVGTPADAINRVQAETAKLLKQPQVMERLVALGLDPVGSTPAEFAEYIRIDVDKWTKLIKELKITLQ